MQQGTTSSVIRTLAVAVTSGVVLGLSGCASGGGSDAEVIRVVYPEQPPSTVASDIVESVAAEFEADNPGTTVELEPINAVDDDYHTQVSLMQRSESTAPDVVLMDSFQINPQVGAGYLAPLDEYLGEWDDWDRQFPETAQDLAVATDGNTYGIPVTGGSIGLWYDKSLFQDAGLPADWRPETWDDVLSAAEALKAADSDTIPFAAHLTQAQGEATAMQTFEVLLQGTEGGLDTTLYDNASNEWVTGSDGFTEALGFIEELQSGDLIPSGMQLQDPNLGTLMGEWFPEDRVGMALTGNWLSAPWKEGGPAPWPEWTEEMGWTAMPTADGSAPGSASIAGGWVWSMASTVSDQDAAFEVLSMLTDAERSLEYCLGTGDMPARDDVIAAPEMEEDPALQYFYQLQDGSGIRPGVEAYPQVSAAIQAASEAVATGSDSSEKAAEDYDSELGEIMDHGGSQ